jgi:TolB protein
VALLARLMLPGLVCALGWSAPALPALALRSPAARLAPPHAAIIFESNRSGRYEIYAMNSQGGHLEPLTDSGLSGSEGSGSPDWMPDGLGLAFSSKRAGDWDLFLARDGSETNLTRAPGEDDKADWSPDGRRVAFSSVREGRRWADIFVMEADGSRVIDLSDDNDDDREPVWSPNGDEIAYRSFRDGNYEINVMDIPSRAPRQLTRTDAPIWNASPAWSPDGHWIAFETNRDGNYELYIMDNNGARLRNLSSNPKDDKEPAWSPDGRKIAFSSNRDGNFELYTLEIASGDVTRLTYDCARDHNPDWRAGDDLPGDPVQTAVATVTGDANLRRGPGAVYATLGGAVANECLTATGRSADGQWLRVRTAQGDDAWVVRSLVALQGDFDALPVSA